ncbi:MAG: hypothetical protein [Arizlama microvirus]|nr:MAG: hypothetical protein [Arizlama microvirus]
MYKDTSNAGRSKGQTFKMPSNTIQGQTLSIQQMLARVQAGVPVNLNGLKYGEDDQPQTRLKDLSDIDDAKQYLRDIKTRNDLFREQENERRRLKAETNAELNTATKNGVPQAATEELTR